MKKQRNNADVLTAWIPIAIAIALLSLFIVPNYWRAGNWKKEANSFRAVAYESAVRQDDLVEMQRDVARLRNELNQRGRMLPNTPDKGALLNSLARTSNNKGVYTHQSKSGKLSSVEIPGIQGGKATRRTVEVQMTGTFDSLFGTVRASENLPALVTVRSIQFACNPKAPQDRSVIDASFTFDEYFTEHAANAALVGIQSKNVRGGSK